MTDEPSENRRRWLERKLKNARNAAAERARPAQAVPHVGLAAYFSKVVAEPARIEDLARLFVDPRWPWLPCWARRYEAGRADWKSSPKAVRVGGTHGYAALSEAIGNPRYFRLDTNRATGDADFASVSLDLDRQAAARGDALKLWVICRTTDLPTGKSFERFATLLHELVAAVGAEHAVLGAWPTRNMAVADTWLGRMLLDTPAGDINLGLPPDFDAQRELTSTHRDRLGQVYARHPRWGTYLHAGHVAAIGGVERIVAEVAPAVIQPVGALTYIQLTDSIDTALTPEAGAKRRALEALMAPILVGAATGTTATERVGTDNGRCR